MPQAMLPQVNIETPTMLVGKNFVDLSDHYPISMTIDSQKIISYNIQQMHTFLTKKKTSALQRQKTIEAIANYFNDNNADICCVQELFDNEANEALAEAMTKHGYHATDRLDRPTVITLFNGGVRCFVKNIDSPTLQTRMHFFTHKIDFFIGGDATANKGAEQISFDHQGHGVHIFNTHLQAYYPGREHYTEITLAQCLELKEIIEQQIKEGIINPHDRVILCGDFNIPKPHAESEETPLFQKMKAILGPNVTFLDYADKQQHTRSRTNTHNRHEPKSSDNDVNLDLGLLYDSRQAASDNEVKLSHIYAGIQLSLAAYVSKNATIFNQWRLDTADKKELHAFNQAFEALIKQAKTLDDPLKSELWLEQVDQLRLRLHTANHRDNSQKRNFSGFVVSATMLMVVPHVAALYVLLSLVYFSAMFLFGLLKSTQPLKPLELHSKRFFKAASQPPDDVQPPQPTPS